LTMVMLLGKRWDNGGSASYENAVHSSLTFFLAYAIVFVLPIIRNQVHCHPNKSGGLDCAGVVLSNFHGRSQDNRRTIISTGSIKYPRILEDTWK
jgi:hypothetical protein